MMRPRHLLITTLVLLVLILRHDFWWWDERWLVFDFMPIGLFYQACVSVAAAAVWYLATRIAWPLDDHEVDAAAGSAPSSSARSQETP